MADNKVNEFLANARKAVSFPVEELTNFLDDGAKNTDHLIHPSIIKARRRWLENLIDSKKEPVFINHDRIFLNREQLYVRALQKSKRLIQLKKQYDLSPTDWNTLIIATGEALPIILNDFMFRPVIEGQMSEEQIKKWLPLVENYAILGCYVQTELGHGSNVRKLETTATYIRETDEFEIHSPTLTSTKWWPGSLARTRYTLNLYPSNVVVNHTNVDWPIFIHSNHGAVFARLIIDNKDYGVHPFIVQFRGKDHKPLPGIEIGDIGPKYGMNVIDNGFLRFTKVRIPRTNMPMKFSKVSNTGVYTRPPHAKMAYGVLVLGRADIIQNAAIILARVLTIAIRYSIIRRQGNDYKDPSQELQVLDYQSQQYKLFRGLAMAYVFLFNARFMRKLIEENLSKVNQGDVSLMAEVHINSAGWKALCTDLVTASIEDARRSCGGHGYSSLSGIPEILSFYSQYPTVEGENTIMYLQTGNYLLKTFQSIKKGKIINGRLNYIKDYKKILLQKSSSKSVEQLLDPDFQLESFRHRFLYLIFNLDSDLKTTSQVHPDGFEGAKSGHIIDTLNVTRAYCYLTILSNAHEGLKSLMKQHPRLYPTLRNLVDLFFVDTVLIQSGDFLMAGYYDSNHIKLLQRTQKQLLRKIRPDAIGLVDAWEFSDNCLNSALGRSDGDVYETMYNWVKEEPSNQKQETGVYVGYNEVLKNVLSGDYLKEIGLSRNDGVEKAKL
ncbi:9624_t:CDS:10 [Acaulospora morrowiae]|uniref:Acyl-coenzyme A oxidase n=1 Tax=Acaulospora morrowiae TaxID=94023 RepID=A0A9N9FXQ1_9GLOM|nr:9624_t:CDS:10 [Acaulospora morrowiae]